MYNIISYNWHLFVRKSQNNEIMLYYFQIVLRNSLDPDWDFWLDPDPGSMNTHPKHCTMSVSPLHFISFSNSAWRKAAHLNVRRRWPAESVLARRWSPRRPPRWEQAAVEPPAPQRRRWRGGAGSGGWGWGGGQWRWGSTPIWQQTNWLLSS